jgi:hypothetical protein
MNIHENYSKYEGVPDTSIITGTELNHRLFTLSDALTVAQQELKDSAIEWAKAENEYRKAKAIAYITIKGAPEQHKATVATLEAMVDKSCADERQRAYMARALKEAALENVRSVRAQINALQSIAASVRSEMEMARY